jgi:hypothetical protein
MNLHDYLLDHAHWQWPELLQHWTWLVPPTFTVWIVNRFGDLFICLDDNSIHHLDIGAGTLKRVAATRDEFCNRIDDPEQANFFLMIPLVDELVAAECLLSPDECYSYRLAPAFQGGYTLDNLVVRPIAEHYNIFGPLHLLTKDIPDGTPIRFTTTPGA